ncbi:MAG: hypothetical protein ABWY11_06965 [Umezawaea sp.]
MDKTLFDEAIGAVPPSTVDVDAIIARQRRAERFRLSAHPWTSAAAGIAVVAIGAAVVLAPGGGSIGAGSGPPGGCGSLLPTTPPLAEDEAAVSTRLSHVFAAAVEGMVPPMTKFGKTSAADYPLGTKHEPLDFYHAFSPIVETDSGCSGGEDHFAAGASVGGGGVLGNVLVVVGRLGGHATPMAECGSGSEERLQCERSTRPDGTVVVTTTISGPTGVRTFCADVTKPDGTGVLVRSANVTTDSKRAAEPEAVAPPFTHEQLVQLALDPGMTLYP